MKSFNDDQRQFIRAAKKILGVNYPAALEEAKAAKLNALEGIAEPTAKQQNLAQSAGNVVLAKAAKIHGVDSIPIYIKNYGGRL